MKNYKLNLTTISNIIKKNKLYKIINIFFENLKNFIYLDNLKKKNNS